jgi:hypothetical protein
MFRLLRGLDQVRQTKQKQCLSLGRRYLRTYLGLNILQEHPQELSHQQ